MKKIIEKISVLELKISHHNSLNLTDINIFSEDFICNLLNLTYNYGLETCEKIHQPSIDLVDEKNSITFQVTSNKRKVKIQKTIDSFYSEKLYVDYPVLYILVLGKKQKDYKNLKSYTEFEFRQSKNIIDFSSLIKKAKSLTARKMRKIIDLFESEFNNDTQQNSSRNLQQLNRNLNLKKKIENDLIRNLNYEQRNIEFYEPNIKFLYHEIIIRSSKDISFPNSDDLTKSGSSSWFKIGLWDFYENGLELQAFGGERIIMDENGYWEILEDSNDSRIEKYKLLRCSIFLKVPFNYIIKYDMEVDPFYGLPSFYLKYNSRNEAFEEIIYGILGNTSKKRKREILDNSKMRKLK
ncbi:MAG: SMEK domain-containing protein [Algibacter sp.]